MKYSIFAVDLKKDMDTFALEEKIVEMLKTVYDPEIPVNVYDLGLIYKIDVSDNADEEGKHEVAIDMTLTAPSCPAGDFIAEDIRIKVNSIKDVKATTINIVFEPEWSQDMMSEEAKLELGFM